MATLSKVAAAVAIFFMLTGVTAFAAQLIIQHIRLNGTNLPELNQMEVVKANEINAKMDEDGIINKTYDTYDALINELNIHLLDSDLAVVNPYMQAGIETDNTHFAMVQVDNYILGDTSNYRIVDGNHYNFDAGSEYSSPISLEADLILSQEQFEIGWDDEYLGYYEYVDSFVSSQGYKVNIIQDTLGDQYNDFVPENCAVFVAEDNMVGKIEAMRRFEVRSIGNECRQQRKIR